MLMAPVDRAKDVHAGPCCRTSLTAPQNAHNGDGSRCSTELVLPSACLSARMQISMHRMPCYSYAAQHADKGSLIRASLRLHLGRGVPSEVCRCKSHPSRTLAPSPSPQSSVSALTCRLLTTSCVAATLSGAGAEDSSPDDSPLEEAS
jgi:hypothetical protein